MEIAQAAHRIHDILIEIGRKWKIDGRLAEPTFDDVERLVGLMLKDIRNLNYDSIESGGILIRKDGHRTDIYVHLGELDEDTSL
jgi:hypothetical protein